MRANVLFRDLLMLMLLGLIAALILLVSWINPVTQTTTEPPPGDLIVRIIWQRGVDIDVDLWVQSPHEQPVGYSAQEGETFNLLRDDLGTDHDGSDAANYEVAFSRGSPAGEYTVNLHLYSIGYGFSAPVPVDVTLSRFRGGSAELLLKRHVILMRRGEETTVWRFRLDSDGELIEGSVSQLFRPLRSQT